MAEPYGRHGRASYAGREHRGGFVQTFSDEAGSEKKSRWLVELNAELDMDGRENEPQDEQGEDEQLSEIQ